MIEAHDAWTISFLPSDVVVFGQMIEGAARVEREDNAGFDLVAGDFMLMAAPPPWTMAGGGGGAPVDFKTAIADPGLLLSARRQATITRFIAGSFTFAPANADLVATLMLPIVHVLGTDPLVSRLGALLSALGDEALRDRPGRSCARSSAGGFADRGVALSTRGHFRRGSGPVGGACRCKNRQGFAHHA